MLSPHIKKNVDKLWNRFWTAGITNPLVAVEQITYLLFLKRLEGLDNERVKKGKPSIYNSAGEQCKWSYIKQDRSPKHLIEVVFPWLRDLEKHFNDSTANGIEAIGSRMSDAYFQLDPNKGAILSEAIDLINALFERVDSIGGAADIMGDTFEYLLSEIATAGKNGQFRTPRHLIRCMVELLDPQAGMKIIDPAAGSGGFLFSALNYLLKQHTEPENLCLEWDGTPHRAHGDQLSPEQYQAIHQGDFYVGLDNDRTMVRIGWMNMILHGLENPQFHQRDSLAKRGSDDKDPLKHILASETYDIVLANPPFTGKVDTEDLESALFPKAGKSGKKVRQVITDKSELLFVWVMLDLLKIGGRCAVIVPEGVLFGGTEAHARLRKELLTEHLVEAVISLPAGMFQPYTGVKTSILVFQKETRKENRDQWKPADPPRTQRVWFYEVSEEAFSLDAKRTERRGGNNDLWDLLEKYKTRHQPDTLAYYQPEYHKELWRMVDDHTQKTFADNREVAYWKGQVAAVNELFAELPADPKQVHAQISATQQPALDDLARAVLLDAVHGAAEAAKKLTAESKRNKEIDKRLGNKAISALRGVCESAAVKKLFDQEEKVAWPLYQKAWQAARDAVFTETALTEWRDKLTTKGDIDIALPDKKQVAQRAETIAREFAKLDGYEVMLRSLKVLKHDDALKETKHWTAPIRVYARDDEWQSEDDTLHGSHNEDGGVRPEYAAGLELYDNKGKLKEDLLDPDCIEARGWNLSAGQYKPFNFAAMQSDKSVAEMIVDLKDREQRILSGLDKLLAMVENRD
ncbi:MAG: SAM-dependent DNA methyltransferase [Gammaproteobacteria bacterium]|nr:SAM-dependent DNA methyltransferase [Gammaproteobacteria bacterium]